MSDKETKTTSIAVRLPPSMKAELQRVAGVERRTVASLVEKVLADFLASQKR